MDNLAADNRTAVGVQLIARSAAVIVVHQHPGFQRPTGVLNESTLQRQHQMIVGDAVVEADNPLNKRLGGVGGIGLRTDFHVIIDAVIVGVIGTGI